MAVMFDSSARSVVVFCTECPGFRDIVTTLSAAHNLAREHLYDVHPGPDSKLARDSISAARRARVAAEPIQVG